MRVFAVAQRLDAVEGELQPGREDRRGRCGFFGLGFDAVVEAQPQVMNVLDPEMAAMVHQQLKSKNVELYRKHFV